MELIRLNESTMHTEFTESAEKPKGVLKVVTGPVADFKPNRNGRTYPRKLWEKVVNSEYVKEMIDSKTLFGEADHPAERTELSLQNVSHSINKLWIDDEKQQVWAEMHILPTPLGEMISNLIDYGSKIGVSSRGAGSVNADGTVNPDDYQFFTFDLVARPSVAAARPDDIVESEENKIADNFKIKVLTESEVKNIIADYRENVSKSEKIVEGFIYNYEGEQKLFKNHFINDLILESVKLNSSENK